MSIHNDCLCNCGATDCFAPVSFRPITKEIRKQWAIWEIERQPFFDKPIKKPVDHDGEPA